MKAEVCLGAQRTTICAGYTHVYSFLDLIEILGYNPDSAPVVELVDRWSSSSRPDHRVPADSADWEHEQRRGAASVGHIETERTHGRRRTRSVHTGQLSAGGGWHAPVAGEPRQPGGAVFRVHPAHWACDRPARRSRRADHRRAPRRRCPHPSSLYRGHAARIPPAGRRAGKRPHRLRAG